MLNICTKFHRTFTFQIREIPQALWTNKPTNKLDRYNTSGWGDDDNARTHDCTDRWLSAATVIM